MPAFNPANSDAGRNEAARKKREAAKGKPKSQPNVSPYGGTANLAPSKPAARQRAASPYGSFTASTSAPAQSKRARSQINIPPLLSAPAQAQQGAPAAKPKPKPKPKDGLAKLWDDAVTLTGRAATEVAKDALGRDLLAPVVFGESGRGRNYTGRQIGVGLTRAVTNLGTLGYSLFAKDVDSGPVGSFLQQIPETLNPFFGGKRPSEMTQEELGRDQLRGDLVGNALVIGATPFKAALAAATTWKGKAAYGGAAFVANELLSQVFTDSRAGNFANAVNDATGAKLPGAVQPDDSYLEAKIKSLAPDAAGAFVLGAAAGTGLRAAGVPFKATKRWLAKSRAVAAEQAEREFQKAAGFTVQDPETGASDFAPEYRQRKSRTAPAGNAPAQPETEIPDPWGLDPAKPPSPALGKAIDDLSDQELEGVLSGSGSVVDRVEQVLQARTQAEQLPSISEGMVMAPADSLAEDYVQSAARKLEARSPEELRSLFDPEVNPGLWRRAEATTGADTPAELSKSDMLEALSAEASSTGMVPLANRLTGAQMLGTDEIAAAPQVFQYKGGINEAGEQLGNSLSGVERWDPNAEGIAQVWRDAQGEIGPPGQVYVVNGHNRLAKAREKGVPSLRVEFLDAPTAAEARLQGAVSNISDGKGTVFDAAKFARENGISDPAQLKAMGKPGASGFWKEGIALGRLPEDVFTAAVNEQIPVRRAVIIGESGADPETMRAAYRYLVEQGPENVREGTLREMLAMAGRSPSASSAGGRQGDLLTGTEWAQSFNEGMLAKANLAAAVRVMLGKEKKLFGTVGRQAKRIEQVGQVDAVAAKEISGEAARALNIFDELKYATGPVGDLLSEGTERILKGENPATVADGIKNRLAAAIKETMGQEAAPAVDVVQPDLMAGAGRQADTPEPEIDRAAIKKQLLGEAIENGEVRPPDAPLPGMPSGPRVRLDQIDMDKPVTPGSPEAQALMDEIRLAAQRMAEEDAINLAAKQAMREAEGYDLKTFNEKKAGGLLEGYGRPPATTAEPLPVEPAASPAPPERPTPVRLSSSLGDQPAFSLPAEPSIAAPKYGSRQVRFASDLDRAAYILLADAKKGTSKAAAKFREALVEQGLDPGAVAEHGLRVKAALRSSTPSGDGVIDLPAQGWMGGDRRSGSYATGGGSIDPFTPPTARKEDWDGIRRLTQENLPELEKELRKIGGDDFSFKVVNGYFKSHTGDPAWGIYRWWEDSVTLWTQTDPAIMNRKNPGLNATEGVPVYPEFLLRAGYHEIMHRIIFNSLSDAEMRILNSKLGRAQVLMMAKEFATEFELQRTPYHEILADVGSYYLFAKRAGQDPVPTMLERIAKQELSNAQLSEPQAKQASRLLESILPSLERVYNFLESSWNFFRHGAYRSTSQIFEDIARGRMANTIEGIAPSKTKTQVDPEGESAKLAWDNLNEVNGRARHYQTQYWDMINIYRKVFPHIAERRHPGYGEALQAARNAPEAFASNNKKHSFYPATVDRDMQPVGDPLRSPSIDRFMTAGKAYEDFAVMEQAFTARTAELKQQLADAMSKANKGGCI